MNVEVLNETEGKFNVVASESFCALKRSQKSFTEMCDVYVETSIPGLAFTYLKVTNFGFEKN